MTATSLGAGMPAAQPPWPVTVRGVDDNPWSGMQECVLVSDREQLVLGAAGAGVETAI